MPTGIAVDPGRVAPGIAHRYGVIMGIAAVASRAAEHDHIGEQHPDRHDHTHGKRATALVPALAIIAMFAGVMAGRWTGSMALPADGRHMARPAAAMGVAVFPYRFVRRPAFTGRHAAVSKAGDPGGFANAAMRAVVAILVAGGSVLRRVALGTIGPGVNLPRAWLLREAPSAHGCDRDPDREAAFVHVLADAPTSALAIAASWGGRRYGLVRLDPVMGLVGAAVTLGRTGRALPGATPAMWAHAQH